jgi:phage terminase large subunit
MPTIILPYAPRPLQLETHEAMDRHRFGALVCHRRFGKTVLAVNQLIKAALLCTRERPRFGYIAPTYSQGKAIAWDYLQHYSRPIPGATAHQSELRIDLPNGGQVRIYGGDNPDSLRGLYFDGVVLDEYGLHRPKVFTEVIAPALSDRAGWALFLGTPNGKNQFYEVVQRAKQLHAEGNPDWHFAEHKASETGYVASSELMLARGAMTEDEYEQEYECSFEAAVRGAYYGKEMAAAEREGRITTVPVDPILPVDTDWDLGIGDSMAIWFSQSLRSGEVRIVDYYEQSGEGLPHYMNVLRAKGYTYGKHWAPHDITVRELTSGRSRLETAAALGLRFEVVPAGSVDDGIHGVRMLLPKCWFDRTRCAAGIDALKHYRKALNAQLNEFKDTPVHDWASHGADAFRLLAARQEAPRAPKAYGHGQAFSGGSGWMA